MFRVTFDNHLLMRGARVWFHRERLQLGEIFGRDWLKSRCMNNSATTLHYIDPSSRSRAEMAHLCLGNGYHCEVYGDIGELAMHPPRSGIILVRDEPRASQIKSIFGRLEKLGIWLPVVVIAEDPQPLDIVAAIKAGALDYLTLPIESDRLLGALEQIGPEAAEYAEARRRVFDARNRIENLSGREREVLDWLSEGSSNKVIARQLEISPRTVEIHRANMMAKLGANHAADAVRLKLEANL